jgi:hypothetical protein
MIQITRIVYAQDTNLVVYINRKQASAPVTFEYLAFDDAPMQSTPYQTANMPSDDQQAAAMVSEYADNMAG